VYSTAVGEDTPILTPLVQWKIVPKKATQQAGASDAPLSVLSVESAFDFVFDIEGAPASSRSSVNNCTGGLRPEDSNSPESFVNIDLNGMNRRERRQLLSQIRAQKPEKRHLQLRRTDKTEAACDNVIGQVKDLSGETISRGLAVCLIGGTQTKIGGLMFRSLPNGDLVRPLLDSKKTNALERFNRLAEKNRTKKAQ
jgi:hypothetical protein